MRKNVFYVFCCLFVISSLSLTGCKSEKSEREEVVIYTSLDKVFSQPILEAFEEETGIEVLAVYDSEATKTTGLVNRLIAEKDKPRADVFWNSETGRTIVLKRKSVLAKYASPSAADIPEQFKDPNSYWAGFAARCRILIYNIDMVKEENMPESIHDLTGPKWRGKIAMAYPLFGTTATHAAALFANFGDKEAREYFQALKANDVMITDGTDIRCLSPHETNEWHPSVTNDGMIIYTRWDYVDRHGCTAHLPWITTPDGRNARAVHGNFAPRELRADMELDIRAIPGSHRFVATGAPHHGQAFGSLVMFDSRIEDDDAMAPVKRLTPEVDFPETQGGAQVYGTAWPLSENYYLCVYDPGISSGIGRQGQKHIRGDYGIYLIDVFGNKELVYHDGEIASQSPMPLRPRHKPPAMPDASRRVAAGQPAEATLALINVYDTLTPWPAEMKIKSLRVYQILPMSVPSGAPPHETSMREPTAGVYGEGPRLIPESKMKEYKQPPKTIERVKSSHEQDWVRACKAGQSAGADFEYSGLLTEVCLLGNAAKRVDARIEWDSDNMKVTNLPQANKYIRTLYRKGWTL